MLRLSDHSLALSVAVLATLCIAAAQADTPVRAEEFVAAGAANHVIPLREHAGWNAACEPIASPALMLDTPPRHGRVCARVDVITIRALYAGTEDQCIGKRVRGVRLEYRPDAGFAGADELRYAAQYPSVRRAIDVSVTVAGEGAAQPVSVPPPRQTAGPVPACLELMF